MPKKKPAPRVHSPGEGVARLVLELGLPPRGLSLNDRCHRMAQARAKSRYRREARLVAELQGRPLAPWQAATVEATYHHKHERVRDQDNFIAQLKPAIDGIVDAGWLVDDRQVTWLPVRFEGAASIFSQGVDLVLTKRKAGQQHFRTSLSAEMIGRKIEVLLTKRHYDQAIAVVLAAAFDGLQPGRLETMLLGQLGLPAAVCDDLAKVGIYTVGDAVSAGQGDQEQLSEPVREQLGRIQTTLAHFFLDGLQSVLQGPS